MKAWITCECGKHNDVSQYLNDDLALICDAKEHEIRNLFMTARCVREALLMYCSAECGSSMDECKSACPQRKLMELVQSIEDSGRFQADIDKVNVGWEI